MKKKSIYIIISVILLLLVFEFLTQSKSPSFLKETVDELQLEKDLMDSIGGFKSYEYSYNKNDLEKDSLDFQIILRGKTSNLFYEGMAVKTNSEWLIVKKEISIKK